MPDKIFKCGYVALIGNPNVGKSTLLNTILNTKLSIVSNKPQTTRQKVVGIYNNDDAQIIFLDTPGLLDPAYLLQNEMLKHAERALFDADIVLSIIDGSQKLEIPEQLIKLLSHIKNKKTNILIINKEEKSNTSELENFIKSFKSSDLFAETIPISALFNKNIRLLIDTIIKYLPIHEAYFPTDIISEQSERFFITEFIREELYRKFTKEVPYTTAVELRSFKERTNGKTFISADIIVDHDSQKGIVVGKEGKVIKDIGLSARKEIEKFLQKEVFLELHVKVRDNWRNNKSMLMTLGYQCKQ